MTLLTVFFAAAVTTALWYRNLPDRSMRLGTLSLIYWGASLMWLVDAIFEYIELKDEYFTPAASDMLNDLFLGLSAVALGLAIWTAVLLIKDPKRVLKKALSEQD